MSWSLKSIGKASTVRADAAEKFAKITYLQGTEAEIKDAAAGIVDKAVSKYPPSAGVDVDCNGSGSSDAQTIVIKVTQVYGFVHKAEEVVAGIGTAIGEATENR